jgi:hypothetical protein
MTKMFNAAQLAELIRKAEAYDSLVAKGLITDFSNTIERVIERLVGKTVWPCEVTGQPVSS